MPHSPGLGAIFGIVSENGTPVENFPVVLMDGSVPRVLRRGMTATDGGFTFSGLNPEVDDYMVVVQDATGDPEADPPDPYKNAQIKDRVQPVYINLGTHYPAAWWAWCLSHMVALAAPGPYVDVKYNQGVVLGASNGHNKIVPQGGIGVFNSTLTPFEGAFNLPVLSFQSDTWMRVYSQTGSVIKRVSQPLYFSLASVVSFDTQWGITLRGNSMTYIYSDGYRSVCPILHLYFDGVDTITVKIPQITGNTHWSGIRDYEWNTENNSTSTYHTLNETVTLSPVPSGFTFVGFYINGAFEIVLVIDEVEYVIASSNTIVDLTTVTKAWRMPTSIADLGLHGGPFAEASTGQQFAFAAVFAQTLTTAELVELKELLFNGGPVDTTGYVRDITVDYPAWLYRMDEFNLITGAVSEHFEGDATVIDASKVGDLETITRELRIVNPTAASIITTVSPLAGIYGIVFNGNYIYASNWVGMGLGDFAFTLSFWFRPDALEARMDLIQNTINSTDSTIKSFCAYCDVGGIIKLYLAGTEEVFVFPSPLVLDTWYHIAFVVNKYNREVRLFLDGNFVEVLSTTAVELPATISNTGNTSSRTNFDPERSSLQVGGRYDGTDFINPTYGALVGIAGFTYPLSDVRVHSHFVNRLVV